MVSENTDPEQLYGPTDAWQGGTPAAPVETEAGAESQQPPPPPTQTVQISQDTLNALDRRYNAALAQFASDMKRDMLEALDQKLVATLNTQAALNTGAAPQAIDPALPATPPNLEALATAAMPIINMIAAKFLGAPAAEAPAGLLQSRFKEVADVVTMVNNTFMNSHDESMRTGMKLTSDAFTFAYKATGQVPEGPAFNAALDHPSAPPSPAQLSRRTVDVQAEAARIAAKITGG